IAPRVPQRRGGAAEKVPAAGRLDGVEAGESARGGERAARHFVARGRAAGPAPVLRPAAEVSPAGTETEEADGEAGDSGEQFVAIDGQVRRVLGAEGNFDSVCGVRRP